MVTYARIIDQGGQHYRLTQAARPLIDRTAKLPWAPVATVAGGATVLNISGPGRWTLSAGVDYVLNFTAQIANTGTEIGTGGTGQRTGVCEFNGGRSVSILKGDFLTPPQIASTLTADFNCATDTTMLVTSVRDTSGNLLSTSDTTNAPFLIRVGGNLISATGVTESPSPRLTGCLDTGSFFNRSGAGPATTTGGYTQHGIIPSGSGVFLGEAYRTPLAIYGYSGTLHVEGIKARATQENLSVVGTSMCDWLHGAGTAASIIQVQNCDLGYNGFSGELAWGLAGHADGLQVTSQVSELRIARSTFRSGMGGRGVLANYANTIRLWDFEHIRDQSAASPYPGQNTGFVTRIVDGTGGAPVLDFRNAWSVTQTGIADPASNAINSAVYNKAQPAYIAQNFAPTDAGLTYTSPGYLP